MPPPSRSLHFLALKRRLCCREVCDVMSELHLAHLKGLVLLPTQNIFYLAFHSPSHTHTTPSLHTLLFSSFDCHFRCAQSEIVTKNYVSMEALFYGSLIFTAYLCSYESANKVHYIWQGIRMTSKLLQWAEV